MSGGPGQRPNKEERNMKLSKISTRFDRLDEISLDNIMPFSQIQANVLTARLSGKISSYNFVTCNKALSEVANLPWSNKKKGYAFISLYPSAFFGILSWDDAKKDDASFYK